ncbi:DUF7018 domain-containing (lipo)protein [Bacillus mycoides]|uniref:DUF7018 domain-containing (lipo)protein n=1 Tax=Bacillus mycoides TaxID=1405 RepID=UPI0036EBFFA6
MKRKLLTVALPIMLVAGVGCSNKDVAEDKKTDSLQVAEADSQKVSKGKEKSDNQKVSETKAEKEYKGKLNALLEDLTKQALELSDVLNNDKTVHDKAPEYIEKSEHLKKTADKLIELDPGEKYADVQNTVKDAMYEAKAGTLLIAQGLNLKAEDLVQKGSEKMEKVSKLLLEVDKKLKALK